MNYKKTACVVLGVCVVLALVIFGLSKIHITKKDTGANVETTEAPVNVKLDDSKKKGVSTEAPTKEPDTTTEVPADVTTEPTVAPTTEPSQSTNNNGWQEINEDSLSYSKEIQSVSGTVTAKKVYNTGDSQIIYDIEITSTLGNTEQLFHYYCTYNTFNELKEKDLVLVEYRQVDENNFVVCSLSK